MLYINELTISKQDGTHQFDSISSTPCESSSQRHPIRNRKHILFYAIGLQDVDKYIQTDLQKSKLTALRLTRLTPTTHRDDYDNCDWCEILTPISDGDHTITAFAALRISSQQQQQKTHAHSNKPAVTFYCVCEMPRRVFPCTSAWMLRRNAKRWCLLCECVCLSRGCKQWKCCARVGCIRTLPMFHAAMQNRVHNAWMSVFRMQRVFGELVANFTPHINTRNWNKHYPFANVCCHSYSGVLFAKPFKWQAKRVWRP